MPIGIGLSRRLNFIRGVWPDRGGKMGYRLETLGEQEGAGTALNPKEKSKEVRAQESELSRP